MKENIAPCDKGSTSRRPDRCNSLIIMLLCIYFHTYTNALAVSNHEVLENITRFDTIFESGFTGSGMWTTHEQLTRGRPESEIKIKRNWRLAFQGERVGYLLEVQEYEKPTYLKAQNGRGSFLENGWRVESIRTKQWGYWGKEASGNHYEDTLIKISPEDEVVEYSKMYNSSIFGPKGIGPNAPKRTMVWSFGRLFSKVINEVTRVDEGTDGCILVTALGIKGEGQPGRWELKIEPAAAWMVREARYYSDIKPEEINCEMKNSGTVWDGSYCIPKTAQCNYWGAIDADSKRNELTFNSVIEPFDERLYQDTKESVIDKRPPKLTIHDYRVSPLSIYQPDKLKDLATDIAGAALEEALLDIKLIDPNKSDATIASGISNNGTNKLRSDEENSTSSSGQSSSSGNSRPWYLLSLKWSVVVLVLAIGCLFCLLFKFRKGK